LEKLNSLFKYLSERPLVLKIIDAILILVVAFGLSSTYIIATNFQALFLSDTQREYNEFVSAVESNKQITVILEKLRGELGAARVGIFQFHNGTTGLGNVPFFYYSQTFESTSPGISSELSKNQRISISIDPSVNEIASGKQFSYELVDPSTPFGHHLDTQGIKQFYRQSLISLDNTFMGFVMVEYVDGRELDLERAQELMQRYASAVAGILVSQ